jgi:very-short-patch-repair endonuclease
MHPNVKQYIDQFERDAVLAGSYRSKLGSAETAFLDLVWGPAFHYDFFGLKAEYPFKDYKGGQRFADFVYIRYGMKLVVEIDGYTTHARDLSPGAFDDHLQRQNDLILSGWLVLRFSANQVTSRPQVCERQLKQAIGHLWTETNIAMSTERANVWALRKAQLLQLGRYGEGYLSASDVTASLKVSRRTAAIWLKRLAAEGCISPVQAGQQRVTRYRLAQGLD